MNLSIGRLLPRRGAVLQTDHWRRVPTIDMRPRKPSPWTSTRLLRGGAVVLLLAELLLLGRLGLDWQNADSQQPVLTRQLKNLQQTQASHQGELKHLQNQLATLKKQQKSQSVDASNPGWTGALAALFAMGTPGIQLQSAANDPKQPGDLIVQGEATGLDAVARFQDEIRTRAQYFTLEGIQWNAGDAGLQFTAKLRIASRGVSGGTS